MSTSKRGGLFWFIFTVATLLASQDSFAKCVGMENYYCAPAVFEKEMPELMVHNYFKLSCSGSIALAHKSVNVVFMDKEPCPAPGTHMVGHLRTLCQDTGEWTKATDSYSREPDFCAKTYEESLREAQAMAAKIPPGTTRAQVQELLKGYEHIGRGTISSEQYYLYPDVVLEIVFDESNGAYSQPDNMVKGEVKVKKITLPQP